MSDYKVVFRSDSSTKGERALTWELGCPLALEAIQVARNVRTGKAYLQVKVRNISGALVESFKATFRVASKDGQTEAVETSLLDADIAPGASFSLPPRLLEASDVASVVCRIESASTAHATWTSKGEPVPVPIPPAFVLSDEAARERCRIVWGENITPVEEKKLLPFAKRKPVLGNGWWVCPCGEANVGRDACFSCGASHEALCLSTNEDVGALRTAAEKREKAQKKKSRRKGVLIAAVALVILAACISVPLAYQAKMQSDYEYARDLLDQGKYAEAEEAFSNLGNYLGSEEMVATVRKEARYHEAMEAYEDGDYENAAQEFEKLEDFKNSSLMVSMCSFASQYPGYLGKSSDSLFLVTDSMGDSWRFWTSRCSVLLNPDGTCLVSIPQDENDRSESTPEQAKDILLEVVGDWAGQWDPFDGSISLPGFPCGSKMTIEGTESLPTGDEENPETSFLVISLAESDSYSYSFWVFDEAEAEKLQ